MIKKMKQDNFLENKDLKNFTNEDLDLGQIISFYSRNKKFISLISGITFILSILFAFSIKKVWEGQFQIVIKSDSVNMNPFSSLNPSLQRFAGLTSQNNSYETEVGILKSPSVLMPVFNFVKSDKENKDPQSNLIFADWLESNLDIKLIKRTSILNISYRDTDKDIILPVLNKMSSAYQDYSGRNKKRSQELTKDFLKEQIILLKERSAKTLKEAQDYAIDQNLLFYNINSAMRFQGIGASLTNNNSLDNLSALRTSRNVIPSNITFEEIRIQAANEIKQIDLQLEGLKDIEVTSDKLLFIGSTIPSLVREGLPLALSDLEREIIRKRTKYTEADVIIKRLSEERDSLIQILKQRIIGFLEAQRTVAEARMKAAERPKEVLFKYKDLTKKAFRDESTLINLENQLAFVELAVARQEDPWKLITDPTLLLNEVAPNKSQIVAVGLIMGILIGSGIAFIIEGKKGVVFDNKKLSQYFETSNIEKMSMKDFDQDSEKILFLRDYFKSNSIKTISLINLEEKNNLYVDKFKKALNKVSPQIKIIQISSLNDLNENINADEILFITQLGKLEIDKVNLLKKRLNNLNSKISEIILIT